MIRASVIIPCRNSGTWLPATLESLSVQGTENFEVVAVDDYSTDNTRDVLESFRGRLNLNVIVPPARLCSASASRNLGFERACGKYIKFLDSDDLVSRDLLKAQISALDSTQNAIAVASWCRFYKYPGDYGTDPVGNTEDLDPLEWILRSMEAGHSMMQCGMFLIPRAVIDRAGLWLPEPSPTDDFEYFIRLLSASEKVCGTGGLLWYRSGMATSLSWRHGGKHGENAAANVVLGLERLRANAPSKRVARVAGKIYTDWAYSLYPQHPAVSKMLIRRAQTCGVNGVRAQGGSLVRWIASRFGWKVARRVQFLAYSIGYQWLSLARPNSSGASRRSVSLMEQ